MKLIKQYIFNIFFVFDEVVNTILGGDPKEGCSSRAGRCLRDHPNKFTFICAKVIDFLVFWQPNHCENHIEPDMGKDDILFPNKKANN